MVCMLVYCTLFAQRLKTHMSIWWNYYWSRSSVYTSHVSSLTLSFSVDKQNWVIMLDLLPSTLVRYTKQSTKYIISSVFSFSAHIKSILIELINAIVASNIYSLLAFIFLPHDISHNQSGGRKRKKGVWDILFINQTKRAFVACAQLRCQLSMDSNTISGKIKFLCRSCL